MWSWREYAGSQGRKQATVRRYLSCSSLCGQNPVLPDPIGLHPFTVVGNHSYCINIQRLGTLATRITEHRWHMPVTGATESRSNCSLLSASLLACSEWEKATLKHVFPRPSLSCRGKQTAQAGRLWSRRVRQPGGIWTQCVPVPTCL